MITNLDTLLKQNARSLYLSAKILPGDIRKAFYCGYLLCRIADTVADTPIIPSEKRLDIIKHFTQTIENNDRKAIKTIKETATGGDGISDGEKALINNIEICMDEFITLNAKHRNIVLDVAHYVCLGMIWDLSYFPSEDSGLLKAVPTEGQTAQYCDYMGGEPGVFWAKLILDGKDDADFIENARKIGSALQITNILRDMPADIKIGRVYLPLTDLTKHNLMPQDLLEKKIYRKLRPIIYKWIGWGLDNLQAAPAFLQKIPRYKFANRAAVAWPVLWSLDTFYLLALADNLLDPAKKQKIKRKHIYRTMISSPLYCLSNASFKKLVEKKTKEIKEILS